MSKGITAELVQDEDCDGVIVVKVNGEEHFRWHECANSQYPEDLSWGRMISDVFYAGVEAQKKLDKETIDDLTEQLDRISEEYRP